MIENKTSNAHTTVNGADQLPSISEDLSVKAHPYVQAYWGSLNAGLASGMRRGIQPRLFQTLAILAVYQHRYPNLPMSAVMLAQPPRLPTENQLPRDPEETARRATRIFENLTRAKAVQLVIERNGGWLLSMDGLMFIQRGLRNRQRLLPTHGSHIRACTACSEDELADWLDEAKELQKRIAPYQGEPTLLMSRAKLSATMVEMAIDRYSHRHQGPEASVGAMWAGLLLGAGAFNRCEEASKDTQDNAYMLKIAPDEEPIEDAQSDEMAPM